MSQGPVEFGTRLRKLRQAKGLTQKDLAGPEYSDAYVSTLEAGRRHPSMEAVQYFARRLGIDEEELLTGRPSGLPIRLDFDIKQARKDLSAGRVEAATALLDLVTAEARRFGLAEIEAAASEAQGRCAILQGAPDRGLELYERAIELLAGQPLTAKVEAIAGKARCLRLMGDLHYSVYVLEQTLEALKREDLWDAGGLLRIHASLVPSYFQLGAHRKASASAAEALRLAPKTEEPERIADMHTNVARVMLAQGRPEEAKRSLSRAEELFSEMELRTEIAHCRLALGYVLSREGKLEAAQQYLELAEETFVATRNRLDEARVKNELGRIAHQLGRPEAATELLMTAISLLQDEGDVPELALAHRELGIAETHRDARSAEKHLREAIRLYERIGADVDLAITYRLLGDVLHTQGNVADAADTYRTGLMALEEAPFSNP